MTVSQTLTDREQRFVDAFLISRKQTDAYIKAGYSPKSARANASRMMDKENIRSAIAAADAGVRKRHAKTIDDMVAELTKLAFAGLSRFITVNDKGECEIDLSKCTPADLDLLAEITLDTYTEGRGKDARQVKRIKIKPYDRLRAIEMLGRHLGLFKEGSDGLTQDPLGDLLKEIMARGSALPVRIMGPLGGSRPPQLKDVSPPYQDAGE